MVSLFGAASETCLEIADRAPYAQCVRCRCARAAALARRRASARRARSCGVRDTRGRRATAEVQHAANDALGVATSASYCAPPSIRRGQQEHATHARSSASNWRASPRCVPSSASVWRELKATPQFSPPPLGGRPEVGRGRWSHRLPHPHWHVRSLGGEGCYVLINCRRSRSSPSAVACVPRSCRSGCRE